MSSSPKILLAGLESWPSVARLPHALQNAGFEVGVLCFEDGCLAATRFRDRQFFWPTGCRRGGQLLRRLEEVVEEWQPDFFVPADDPMVAFVARAFARLRRTSRLHALLKFSLGNPVALLEAGSKRGTFERASRCGVRVPPSRVVATEAEMLSFTRENGYPFLLKRSFGWAGSGVAVCRTEGEAMAHWRSWHPRAEWKRRFYAWRNSIRGREIGARWLPTDRTVIASDFISGKPAMCLVTVFAGHLLAGVTAFKEKTFPDVKGPSSVVRLVRMDELRSAAEKLVAAWGLSGFIGFDFMVDSLGDAWLIECNPRSTALAHLSARVGEDICLALHHQLVGLPRPKLQQDGDLTVAHFPNELLRDSSSPYLNSPMLDVPRDDPSLVQRLLRDCPIQFPMG